MNNLPLNLGDQQDLVEDFDPWAKYEKTYVQVSHMYLIAI